MSGADNRFRQDAGRARVPAGGERRTDILGEENLKYWLTFVRFVLMRASVSFLVLLMRSRAERDRSLGDFSFFLLLLLFIFYLARANGEKIQQTKSEDLTSGCRKHAALVPLCPLEPGNLSASFMVDLTAQKPRMHYGDYTERVYAETEEGSAWL